MVCGETVATTYADITKLRRAATRYIVSQTSWTRKAKNTDIEELLMCHGEGFSDEKLKHNRLLETDDDTGVDDTQVQRKQNHAVLSCYFTRIAETTQSCVELTIMAATECS